MNPTDNTADPSFEESIASVLSTVPAPIREFLTGPARDQVLGTLTTKYGLPLDQAGELERLLILMLLGLVEPEAFASGLGEAGIAPETIGKLTEELNTLVFQPIQDKIRIPGGEEKKPVQANPPTAPQTPRPVVKPPPAPPTNLPGVMMPKAPAPVAQPKPIAKPVFATSFAPNAAPVAPAAPKSPGMPAAPQNSALSGALKAAGIPLLEDHEEPHIEFKKPVPPPPAPAPRVMPTTMPPVQPAPAPQRPSAPQQPPVKSYAVDPYREQPDPNEL